MMPRYFDKYWRLISIEERSRLHEIVDYRVISFTDFKDWTRVSTVWLWIDHRMLGSWDPIIFETMVFSSNKFIDQDMRRYTKLNDAKEWHRETVQMVSKHLSLKPKS